MAAPKKPSGTRVFESTQSFGYTDEDGVSYIIPVGKRYREGHPVLKGREDFFKVADNAVEEVPSEQE